MGIFETICIEKTRACIKQVTVGMDAGERYARVLRRKILRTLQLIESRGKVFRIAPRLLDYEMKSYAVKQ